MKTLFAALFSLSLATSASAATVSVDNTTYEVTTLTGRFNDNLGVLQSQVWWNKSNVATSFAALVLNLFGQPNKNNFVPLFATSLVNNTVNGTAFSLQAIPGSVATATVSANNKNAVYAIATVVPAVVPAAVPVPAAGLLLMSALAGIAALRSRRRRIV
ncbi:hypothetical protein [Loktanella sp. M215]|uniref:hypothetical protein n=1 Tax=Loktanella sp. M215 TaxID=2675431 RepID=UPI001F19C30E|nr:hypothetical protein [Loktanella sp. M215]MCF7698505.1 hypothetical protein [Loktanella sp. M215]